MKGALYAAGMRPGDLYNCFSYHLVPAGLMFDLAAPWAARWCQAA